MIGGMRRNAGTGTRLANRGTQRTVPLQLGELEERATPNASQLDPTFADAGRALISSINGVSLTGAVDVAQDTQGRSLVLAGSENDFAVFRLFPNGQIDPNFGINGTAVIPINLGGTNRDESGQILITFDGQILITGNAESAGNEDIAVVRLTADGLLDGGFGFGGVTVVDFGRDETPQAIVQQLDGSILVGGTSSEPFDPARTGPTPRDAVIFRLSPNGQLDGGFGIGGKVVVDLADGANSELAGMFLDNQQRLVFGGGFGPGAITQGLVGRLTPTGQLDASFDGDGTKNVPIPGRAFITPSDFIRTADGRMILVGTTDLLEVSVLRLTSEGDLDTTFGGGDGIVSNTFPVIVITGSVNANSAAVDTAGRIYLFGQASDRFGGSGVVWRFTPQGEIDNSFADQGRTGLFFTDSGFFNANSIESGLLQSDGAIVIVGAANVSGSGFARLQGTFTPQAYAVGADASGGPLITLGQTGEVLSVFEPGFTGGVRVAMADLNGDGIDELLYASGPGRANRVQILDGATRTMILDFSPFEESFTGGLFLSTGDLNGDGFADFAISPDEGGGPRIRVFNGRTLTQIDDFLGIEDPNFRGGARSALADLNGDGFADLLVAAGFGGGPRVAAFSGQALATGQRVKLFSDFFVFEQTLRNGVFLTGGDLDGDGFAELIVGGGPGGGPRVFALSGRELALNGAQVQRANFFAGDPNNRGGVRLAVKHLNQDDRIDLLTAVGPGGGAVITGYDGQSMPADGTPTTIFASDVFPGFAGGVFVG
ncbi:FG-GAP-like repeat-containing protein [Tuwongella immobilis]|uniref:FG-GAP repeat protein n=1 Tax=Tuwongella immobilis TaxID=692036 RepID=A0A6C2YVN2_9BACT|nr:FG-GAP-like repeat-containing protein [Tuwongella immobilis]VIP05427.1 Hemolysin-type calcium-binding region domain protein OS=Rhodopirellula maiorica SM1 GN=RMSM_03614 PE=4 SV=1: VCBS [Tuwongella immobilis]VTS08210.1 Hemolysin-type calcium-binding region domain protein OS=Rhodopirellula maiorica SM1 GN=RMSM_03614 PE=4 SV=1: VCBS [Tuwongella immobilis]